MPGIGKPLRLRLFLEGQEVPVISASVGIGLNSPATCSVQIVPLDEGMDLKPRTMVHLFFLDEIPTAAELNDAKKKGISEELYKLSYYKLLFTGEVVGFAFNQTPMSRGLVLQCLDFSSYWDACHATAIEYGPGGNAFYNSSGLYAANASLFDDIVNHQAERLVGWLKKKPLTPGLQNVSGLAGGIISMLEAIGGVPGHNKGVNDFFTFAELRCKILAQITAEENDNTASKLLSGKVFDEWLRNGLQNIGQQVTFRDMAKLLCSYIYYDFVPNPVAKFDPSVSGTTSTTTSPSELNKSPISIGVVAALKLISTALQSAMDFRTPDAIKNTAASQSLALDKQAKVLKQLGASTTPATTNMNSAKLILDVRITKNTNLDNAIAANDSPGQQTNSTGVIFRDANFEVLKAIEKIETNTANITLTSTQSTASTARLRSHIFRPDCFFSPAPRCNVIFPEHFSQISFDRTYLSEVTRSLTLVYNTLVGRDQMLADKIMAPNIGLDMAKIQKQSGDSGYRILMPHERHTGIIPRSEWLPNTAAFGNLPSADRSKMRGARLTWADRAALFHFFKYRFGPRRVNVAGKFNPYVVCGFPAVVILKPFIPDSKKLREALKATENDIIEGTDKKVLDLVQTNGTDTISLGAPFQILGMVGGVTHSIDQSGGSTSISMSHARRHLGIDDEFVGIFSEETSSNKTRIKIPITADKAFDANDDEQIKVLVGATPQSASAGSSSSTQNVSRGRSTEYTNSQFDPQSGRIVDTIKTRDINQSTESSTSASNDPVDPNGHIDGVQRTVSIPKPPGQLTRGSKAPFNAKGTIVGIEVVDPTLVTVPAGTYKGQQVFRAVVLHEDIDVNVVTQAPVEEIIRPTWFSPNYSNPKIGDQIYMPFFGTTSIIDQLKFTGLTADAITSVDDPEGTTYSPTKKFEEIQQDLSNKQNNNSRLSIERAINIISYFYGMVRVEGKDIDRFVRDYSVRPIATMVDILGSPDLSISYDSNGKPTVNKGKLGFHSLAIDWLAIANGNLTGLLDDPDQQLPRTNNQGKKEPISPVYDVRQEKLDRVDNYIAALKKGPGFRG